MGMLTTLRQRVGAFIGGFEGGLSARRLKGFHASRAHVNTLIQASGIDMTARARFLIRNNGYAVSAVESFCGNVVGTGIKPSSGIMDAALKDEVQRLWLRWTDESDAEGLTDFYPVFNKNRQKKAEKTTFLPVFRKNINYFNGHISKTSNVVPEVKKYSLHYLSSMLCLTHVYSTDKNENFDNRPKLHNFSHCRWYA